MYIPKVLKYFLLAEIIIFVTLDARLPNPDNEEDKEAISKEMLNVFMGSMGGENDELLVTEKFVEGYMERIGPKRAAMKILELMVNVKDHSAIPKTIPMAEVEKNMVKVKGLMQQFVEEEKIKKEERESEEGKVEEEDEHKTADGEKQEPEFRDDNDDGFPDHEPIYQPSEDGHEDILDDQPRHTEEHDQRPLESYEEVIERFHAWKEEHDGVEQNQDPDMEDHDPIYQPEEEGFNEDDGERIVPSSDTEADSTIEVDDITILNPDMYNNEDPPELFKDEDLNQDGYPDHEPIYQPEDEAMRSEIKQNEEQFTDENNEARENKESDLRDEL